ncbi:hypothetical protein, partial [Burkholderia ubonensis]|uniref:hypothetical protein n=1 Tax=Burkholderia ubonensis TaxID=101571 RepID=UPI001E37C90E
RAADDRRRKTKAVVRRLDLLHPVILAGHALNLTLPLPLNELTISKKDAEQMSGAQHGEMEKRLARRDSTIDQTRVSRS